MTARAPAWEPFAAAIAFAAWVTALGPWWGVYAFDADEGGNLMKALLVADGHRLYTEIWSDQPPVFTWALAAVTAVAGPDVAAARGLVLAFAALLVVSLFRLVRRADGRAAAWVAVAALAASPLVLRLGVSVMIGLPAAALAVAALDQATVAGRPRLWLSAGLMAAAVMCKLFVAVAVPAALVLVAAAASDASLRARLTRLAEWSAVAGLVAAAITLAAVPDAAEALVRTHVDAGAVEAFRLQGGAGRLVAMVEKNAAVAILGVVGLALSLSMRRRHVAQPLVWIVVAAVVLVGHRPLWYHHALVLVVPLAWLAGGIGGALADAAGRAREGAAPGRWRTGRAVAAGLAIVVAAPYAAEAMAETREAFHARPSNAERRALGALRMHAEGTRWVVTDSPIDAVRAGLRVPPPLAVFSLKRLKTGGLTPDGVVAVLEAYRPGVVSYRRVYMGRAVADHLGRHYVAVENSAELSFFVARPTADGQP